jgi:glycosyltransferase involved in cell wall biosynthesis
MAIKVLSIGSDRNLFVDGSESQKRIKEYGKLFGELHIVVFADESLGFKNIELENNVFIYPTNHKYKALYLWHIYKIVKKLLVVGGSWPDRQLSVVTSQDPSESALAGYLLKLRYKIPLQIQIHTDIFSPYFWQESLLNKIRVLMAKFLLPKADAIRVVSERIKNSLTNNLQPMPTGRQVTTNNVSVLPIYVDIKKIQSAKVKVDLRKKYPEYDFIILMASRLTKEKNIGLAIEAMKDVVKKHPKALLLIVGDGPEKSNLQLEQNVKFESAVDAQTLFSYYKTTDLFLLTSNYEGYGRTIIEAMAAGCPVVMTDVGLAGELLVDDLDGLVVPVGDKAALAEAIQELIQNKEKREGLVTESQKIINSLPEKKEYLDSYKNSLNL